jgi:cytidylate kinase
VIRIITIEREFGSGGAIIAQRLADRLGWRLLDRSLTEEIAKLAKVDFSAVQRCDERVDPLLYRLGKVFWRGSYELALPIAEPFDADCMLGWAQRVVEDAAGSGNCVIVGRGSPYFLRRREDTLRVFIFAPREQKIRRVRQQGYSERKAIELVDTIDAQRAAFVKKYFGKEWPYRWLYHVMINSAAGDDFVIETILHTMVMIADRHPVASAG